MKISYNWLHHYIDLSEFSLEEIADKLTFSGLEVEGIEQYEQVRGSLEGLLIGEVVSCEKHPDADKLSVTKVDAGQPELLNIVCGAPNVQKGQKVLVAPVGSTIYPKNQEPVKLKKAKIRGWASEGMILAEDEAGLGSSHEGIMVLDTDLPNGTPASNFFNPAKDAVIEIGLTPNRADAASHYGVARDLRAILQKPLTLSDTSSFEVDEHTLSIPVRVENQEACPRYSSLTISGVTVGPSPVWLQTALRSIGVAPINNVVDVTNYVLHDIGQPLHAFDADKIAGGEVVVKTLPKGTRFITLDEKERILQEDDLMICNSQEGMCIAGVFGGLHSGVTKATTKVFLESACFSPAYIRKTAQHHSLKTDASFRFERGTDPEITVTALKKAASMIKELAGGVISSEISDVYPEPVPPFKVQVKYHNINRLIGKKIPVQEIHRILTDLEIRVEEDKEEGFTALVPVYRVDVTREADIIEEILRVYGYNNVALPEHLSAGYLSEFPALDADLIQFQVTQLLVGTGFNEIITNSLTNPAYTRSAGLQFDTEEVPILNKLSEELGVMRQTLLFSGLEVVAYNLNHRQANLKLFEMGKTYGLYDGRYVEKNLLAIYMTGSIEAESWRNPSRKVDFHDLAAVVSRVVNRFVTSAPEQRKYSGPLLDFGLELMSDGHTIGRLGKVSRTACKVLEIRQDVFYAELDWQWLLQSGSSRYDYQEVSKFPEVRRDLSLVIDKRVTFDQIREVAIKNGNRLIRQVNIFDYYEGDKIDSGKKAYALSFILQDRDKTLTENTIDKTMNRLMKAFETELEAIIRQ